MFTPTVFYLVVPLIAGILSGYLIRGKRKMELGKLTIAAVVLLIFSLGFSVGSNSALLSALPVVGANALVTMLLAVGFSVSLVVLAVKKLGMK